MTCARMTPEYEGGDPPLPTGEQDSTRGTLMMELIERIRTDLKADPYYTQNFYNEGQQFLAWYLRNCCLRTPVQAKDDITDGPNDKEFDAIIVDDEKRHIVIIQSKFY